MFICMIKVLFCVLLCVPLILLLFKVDQRLKINMLSTFWLFLYSHLHFIWEFMYRQTVGTPPKLTMKVKASELKVNLSPWNESVILIGLWCKLVLSPSTVKTFTFSYQPEHWTIDICLAAVKCWEWRDGGIDCSWVLANLCCWIQDPLTVLSLDTGN